MKRTIIFIDGSNLYHILKKEVEEIKAEFHFIMEKFLDFISKGTDLMETYYYTAPLDKKKNEETYKEQQKFFNKIKRIPNFNLVLCRLQKEKIDGKIIYRVKEDDINLASDMIHLAHKNKYDEAILVSSDGDFVPAIKIVKEIGKEVKNICFQSRISWHLIKECSSFKKIKKEELKNFII